MWVRLRIKVARVLVLPFRALIKFVYWLPLMVLKPKMTAVELFRYLLGACGRIIAQCYRSEKMYLCHGYNFFVVDLVPLKGGNEFGTPPQNKILVTFRGVLEIFRQAHSSPL